MFKAWDRVIYNDPEDGIVNEKATVLGIEEINNSPWDTFYQLRMDNKNILPYSHSCNGKCEVGYRKYGFGLYLTLITNKPA